MAGEAQVPTTQLSIQIRPLKSEVFSLDATGATTLNELKEMIQERLGVKPSNQILASGKKQLREGSKSLDELQIGESATLMLIINEEPVEMSGAFLSEIEKKLEDIDEELMLEMRGVVIETKYARKFNEMQIEDEEVLEDMWRQMQEQMREETVKAKGKGNEVRNALETHEERVEKCLFAAATVLQPDIMIPMLVARADPNTTAITGGGLYPLLSVATIGIMGTVKGTGKGNTNFTEAAKAFQHLIEAKADVNVGLKRKKGEGKGKTPLGHLVDTAVDEDMPHESVGQIARALLDAGADVNFHGDNPLTPVEVAKRGGADALVRILEGGR